MFEDKKFKTPRIWSNKELKKYAHLFTGNIINVSAWKDEDGQGDYYKNYFKYAKTYSLTNYKSEARGYQGKKNEIFLDLEKELPNELKSKYDVVFNHTTLEHIYDVNSAFNNLCDMSKDIVIVVVPFLQQMHADYGDYWRFTPLAIKKMFERKGLTTLYSSFNEDKFSSVYLFFIASKKPENWQNKISNKFTYRTKKRFCFQDLKSNYIGCRSIKNNFFINLKKFYKNGFKIKKDNKK